MVVMAVSKKAHRTHIEGRQKGGALELKIGANGQHGVNGQYLAAMVSQHTGQKKAFKKQ